ncbi:hypothetical protein [Bradyrhizobium sp. CCBAU 11361]|uniref:hypothetical protein n=1 Tax=Bradyrhizobium sp. CCBAU 11361 TaxID=1630812 RepID=UPI002305842A|nr:hypothetical protein [Bradyrhizobium sp. CCBAU 11361]MDA9492403.1 hypothetical protein [Bradyrhizobium sp. CCBAU 11361]
MLRVVIEICPGGDVSVARPIATAVIANVSDLADISEYSVSATEGHTPIAMAASRACTGRIIGHDRRTSVWELIAKAASWAAKEAHKATK